MNCPDVQERLIDSVLDEVPEDERDEVLRHVSGCVVCEAERERLAVTVQHLRDLAWDPATEVLEPHRWEQLESTARKPRAPKLVRRWLVAASLATVAVGGLWELSPYRTRPSDLPRVWEPRSELRYQTPVAPAAPSPPSADSFTTPHDHEALTALGYSDGGWPAKKVPSEDKISAFSGGVPGGVVGGVVGGLPDAPTADMFFEAKGTNGFKSADRDPLTTFGLDVDTASYTIVRNYLRRGEKPPAEAVRVEEFVNAMPQDYPAPTDETFGIYVEGAPSPYHAGQHLLRIGLRAKDVPPADRKPAVLTFVIDVSGSMAMENRLGLVKRSLRLLVDKLGDSDRIGIVVYGTNGRVVLESTPVLYRQEIIDAIESLASEGSTNLEEGLGLGYRMASRAFDSGANNRVVLCTDGVANNGVSDAKTLLKQIDGQAKRGVDMIALGFGMGNYNDALLQKLADEGNGQYAYIDDLREARNFFLRNLTGLLEVVARDAKVQVEFDPSRVERYRLLGYEKRAIAHEDFRNDTVDGGEVNAGQTVTVLYELVLRSTSGRLGEVRVRYLEPDTREPKESSREIAEESLRDSFEDASPRFQLTVLTARFAEHLRNSPWVKGESLEQVLELAESLPLSAKPAPEANELVDLLKKAIRLSKSRR